MTCQGISRKKVRLFVGVVWRIAPDRCGRRDAEFRGHNRNSERHVEAIRESNSDKGCILTYPQMDVVIGGNQVP